MSYNVNILSGLSAFTINTFFHNEVKSFLKQQFYYSIQSQVPCKLKETQAHENKSSTAQAAKSDDFVILAIFYQKNETLADSLDLWWIFLISNLHIMYLFRNGGFSKKNGRFHGISKRNRPLQNHHFQLSKRYAEMIPSHQFCEWAKTSSAQKTRIILQTSRFELLVFDCTFHTVHPHKIVSYHVCDFSRLQNIALKSLENKEPIPDIKNKSQLWFNDCH